MFPFKNRRRDGTRWPISRPAGRQPGMSVGEWHENCTPLFCRATERVFMGVNEVSRRRQSSLLIVHSLQRYVEYMVNSEQRSLTILVTILVTINSGMFYVLPYVSTASCIAATGGARYCPCHKLQHCQQRLLLHH